MIQSIELNNSRTIPQIGVGTWTLKGEEATKNVNLELTTFELSDDDMKAISALNQNLRSNVNNDPETFPW